MGGCSSKPKTTEFEGAMDLQEDMLQDEPAKKSLDPEKKGMDTGLKSIDRSNSEKKGSSGHSLQTLFVESERGDLRNMLLESEKQPIAGFNPEDNGKKAEEKSEETCDQSSAKCAEGETLGAQKEHSVTEGETPEPVIEEREIATEKETLKLQKEPVVPAAETLELQKEPVVVEEETVELQEEAVPAAAEAETPESQKEAVIESEETLNIQKEPVLAEDETLELHKEPIVAEEEASEPQKEPFVAEEEASEPQKEPFVAEEEALELQKEPIVAREETLELLKESIVADEGTAELQEEAPREVEKESKKSQILEPIYVDKGIELDAGPGCGGEAKQGKAESKEGEVLSDGTETVACKVGSGTDDGTVVQVEEILEKASEHVKEEEKAQIEAIDEAIDGQSALITSRSLDNGETTAESSTTSSKPPSEVKENDTSCVVPPAVTDLPEESTLPGNESPRDVEPVVGESPPMDTPTTTVPGCTVEENQMQVQEADEATSMSDELQSEPESSAEPHAEPTTEAVIPLSVPDIQPEGDSVVRELSTEASPVEGELAHEEISVEGKEPSFTAEVESSITEALIPGEPAPREVPKESMDSVQGEQINSPVICNASEREPDVTSDQVKAPQDLEVSEGLVIDHEGSPAASQPCESTEVIATTEKSSPPEVQLVHVAEGNEPAEPISSKDISTQEIAPDIDEVLEKLASEFERQESLSSSTP